MLEQPLTPRARRDSEWLQHKLGQRLRAPVREPLIPSGDVGWMVEVERSTGKMRWYYGATLEDVYAHIREDVERAVEEARRARALAG